MSCAKNRIIIVQDAEPTAGTIGPQGLPGIEGAAGAQGPAGTAGIQGAIGPQGLQGLTGTAGVNATPVKLTDNTNGTVTIDAGIGNIQTVIRPIDEQTIATTAITAGDKLTFADNGTTTHWAITLATLKRTLQDEMAVAEVVKNAPGGIIPATVVVDGQTVPTNHYVDYNGSHASPIVLPIPVHNGQRFLFNHAAILDTSVAVTNTSMATPAVFTLARKGGEWVAAGGQWHLTTG